MPQTELHTAAENGRVADVERLIAARAELEANDGYGYTPLHTAAWKGHVEVAEKLLAAGADIGATTNVRDPGRGGGGALQERCRGGA